LATVPGDLQELREAFMEALASGKLVLLDPLPLGVRLRLWRDGKANHLACWLVERGHSGTAIALWRALGLWEA
jgi:hypothetical protein